MSHFQAMRQQRLKAVLTMIKDILGPDRQTMTRDERADLIPRICFDFGVTSKKAREYVRISLTRLEFERIDPEASALLDHLKKTQSKKKKED